MNFSVFIVAAALTGLGAVACQLVETQSPTPTTIIDSTSPPATTTTVTISTPTGSPPTIVATPELFFVEDAEPRQLTTNPGDELDPAWDPRGGTIAYMTFKPGATSRPYDIGAVGPDGTNQRVLATGPNRDIGIAGELSWVGETGRLMTNERISIHSYMTFDTAKAPFNRSASDGDDAAFTSSLLIPGGMGGDGLSISRDGKTAMWMIRTSHDPASWVLTVRSADIAALNGQSANDYGNVLVTEGRDFNRGFSMAPDASFFVISVKDGDGYDLSLRDSSTGEEIRRITTTGASDGVLNMYPDVSPDGNMVAFSARPNAEGRGDLYLVQVDGKDMAKITDSPDFSDLRPSWSPDGTQLAFQRKNHTSDRPNWDIYVVDVFGSATTIKPTMIPGATGTTPTQMATVNPTLTTIATLATPTPGATAMATVTPTATHFAPTPAATDMPTSTPAATRITPTPAITPESTTETTPTPEICDTDRTGEILDPSILVTGSYVGCRRSDDDDSIATLDITLAEGPLQQGLIAKVSGYLIIYDPHVGSGELDLEISQIKHQPMELSFMVYVDIEGANNNCFYVGEVFPNRIARGTYHCSMTTGGGFTVTTDSGNWAANRVGN